MKPISLKENTLFRRAYYRGRCYKSYLMIMYTLPNRLPYPRLGITVSAKIGKAVVRNRIRRRMSEAFRLEFGAASRGVDIVLCARHSILQADFAQIQKAVVRLLKDAGL